MSGSKESVASIENALMRAEMIVLDLICTHCNAILVLKSIPPRRLICAQVRILLQQEAAEAESKFELDILDENKLSYYTFYFYLKLFILCSSFLVPKTTILAVFARNVPDNDNRKVIWSNSPDDSLLHHTTW